MKSLLKYAYLCLCGLLLSAIYWWCYFDYHTKLSAADISERTTAIDSDDVSFDKKLLVHRLLKYDLDSGVSSQAIYEKALIHTNHFFSESYSQCHSENEILKKVTCVNRTLGKYFTYQSSSSVSHYAEQLSDCDLNSYLMMDALAKMNIQLDIVYAPYHAFVSWSERGGRYFWETTAKDNTGEEVDLSDKNMYAPSENVAFYHPKKASYAEDLYKVLVDRETSFSDQERMGVLQSSYHLTDSNIIALIHIFNLKKKLNQLNDQDISEIESEYQYSDMGNSFRIILANYYLGQNKKDLAESVLNTVDMDRCGEGCYQLAVDIGVLHYILLKPLYDITQSSSRFLSFDVGYSDIADGVHIYIALLLSVLCVFCTLIFCRKYRK